LIVDRRLGGSNRGACGKGFPQYSGAFLALVFILAREGEALNEVSLLRRITFQAGDPQDPLILARYIDLHLKDTGCAAASDHAS
jgi:hypothetical protein